MMRLPHRSGYVLKRAMRLRAGKKAGFLLVEVMMGIALFALFLISAGLVLLGGQESTEASGDRVRATFLAERLLEVARDIRGGGGFAALTPGQHGVALDAGGKWQWSGAASTATGNFLTSVLIQPVNAEVRRLSAEAKWKHGYARSGSVILTTELTNWRMTCETGDWALAAAEGAITSGTAVQYNGAAVAGNMAYVAAGTAPALHMVNLPDPASALPWSYSSAGTYSILDAGGTPVIAMAVAVRGARLYVLTSETSGELHVLDISSPASPAEVAAAKTDIDGTPTSLAVIGDTLYVGATNASAHELLSFDIMDANAVVALKTGDTPVDDVVALALSETGAYLALASTNEFAVVDTSHATLNADGAAVRNLTGDRPALSITRSGTGILLGCTKDSGTGRGNVWFFKLIDGLVGVPILHEASGSVVGTDMDPLGRYAFFAAGGGRKALQVVNMPTFTAAGELKSLDVPAPEKGRGVFYDIVRDRVYLFTSHAFRVIKPGPVPGSMPSAESRPCT